MYRKPITCRQCKNHCKTKAVLADDGSILYVEDCGCPRGEAYVRRAIVNPASVEAEEESRP